VVARAAAEQRETDGLWFGRQTHRRQDGISAPRRDRQARRSRGGYLCCSRQAARLPGFRLDWCALPSSGLSPLAAGPNGTSARGQRHC